MSYVEREAALLASYAMHAADSAGRRHAEPDHPYRSPFQRDRDRITHTSAFRRLSHKTQVFTRDLAATRIGDAGDYHRSRLTHTLEVASIARTVARTLRLNEDLVEALALAHDVGHPPFGHAGEEVLNEQLADEGGFNHNAQAVRIFTRLERRYPDRPGLNLTAEVLEGQSARAAKPARTAERLAPEPNAEVGPTGSPLLEAQVVDAADSIAYDSHDADDALEIGLLTLGDLEPVTLWGESAERVRQRYAVLDEDDQRRATVHELIDRQVGDLIRSLTAAVAERGVDSVEAVRAAPPLASHSAELGEQKLELEAFLFQRVYRHPLVLEHRREATDALRDAFQRCLATPAQLPSRFEPVVAEESLRRAVADHLSSLTDRAILKGGSTAG